jgi:hypothetical protein
MSSLRKEIEKSKEENKEVPLDIESLSDIVEAELDNVSGGGHEECSWTHSRMVENVDSAL